MPGPLRSREDLVNYTKARLGYPVIQINVEEYQLSDRIDDALQYFQQYHADSMQLSYIEHVISQQDMDQQYLDMSIVPGSGSTVNGQSYIIGTNTNFANDFTPGQTRLSIGGQTCNVIQANSTTFINTDVTFPFTSNNVPIQLISGADTVIGINRIFPISSSLTTVNMFDLRYQLRLHELYDFTSTSYVNYVITQQHLRTLDMLFSGEIPIRYNKHQNRLYIDCLWGTDLFVGEYIVAEGWKILSPEHFPDVWDDRLLKKLATAYVKRQWSENLSKYGGMKLPGGITLRGPEMYREAMDEIEKIEEEIRDQESPPSFIVG